MNGDGYLDMVTVNDGEIVEQNFGSRREHIFLNKVGNILSMQLKNFGRHQKILVQMIIMSSSLITIQTEILIFF